MFDPLVNKEFQRIMLDSTTIWINMLDRDANISFWNKAAEKISGYTKEEVLGNGCIWEKLYPDEAYRTMIYSKAMDIIEKNDVLIDFETTIVAKDGSRHELSWNTHNIRDNEGSVVGSIAVARDVTQIRENEHKLEELAQELETSNKRLRELSYLDQLTNIPNRRAYDEKISDALHAAKRLDHELSVLMIDIDHFKEYNDNYGHEKGDEILTTIAHTIRSNLVRETDFLARYGGEEIVVILPSTPLDHATVLAQKFIQKVMDLNIEHRYSHCEKILTISIGIASSADGCDALIDHADKALYQAKACGRNQCVVYDPKLYEHA